MSFTKAPSFDFSISSFGGVDLSSIPMAFYFVNSSLHWVLEQYTDPHYTTLDLRHTICPACDALPVPSIPDILYESTLVVGKTIKQLAHGVREKLRTWWKKVTKFLSPKG